VKQLIERNIYFVVVFFLGFWNGHNSKLTWLGAIAMSVVCVGVGTLWRARDP